MKDFTLDNLTDEVVRAYTANTADARLREILAALIRHLHGFAREVALSEDEWLAAVRFLTATGQQCDARRQEFILLSDTLGLSMLVDAINHPKGGKGTASTVLGPFYVADAPVRPYGADLRERALAGTTPCLVRGQVTDADGRPLAAACVEVWQTAANGLYDVQDAEAPAWNLRGRLTTDDDGRYAFVTEQPVSYPVPTDGPVGRLLDAAGRHAYRPAHIHFRISAPGHATLVTHVFVAGDPYLDSDAVFATKAALVGHFERCDDAALGARFGIAPPFTTLAFDFGLMTAA
ncbi:MAG: intradiol ring-cleavage dioxygenase [Gammaproteobacteria bacterium]